MASLQSLYPGLIDVDYGGVMVTECQADPGRESDVPRTDDRYAQSGLLAGPCAALAAPGRPAFP